MYSIESVLLLTVLPDGMDACSKGLDRLIFSIKKRERSRNQTRKTIFRLGRREERGKWFYGLWALHSSPECSTVVNNLVVH